MIVYGSRVYGRKNSIWGWGHCENCGIFGRNRSYNGRRWGHLYFIPLVPEGPRVRIVKECKKCSHGIPISEKDVPGLLNDLRQSVNNALAALLEGEKFFDDNGTRKPCAAAIAGAVEMLLCLRADDYLRMVSATLHDKGFNHVYHLTNGELHKFNGALDEAEESYRMAAECEPDDAAALMAQGSIYLIKKDYRSANQVYEQALPLSEDRVPALSALLTTCLLTTCEELNDYGRLAEIYEEMFSLVPEIAGDKKAIKAYRKACNKTGRQPVV